MLRALPVALLLSQAAYAGERAIPTTSLPAAVQAAIASGYPGATIREASTEIEDGATEYEAEIALGERTVDLAYSADGGLLEEEEIVSLASTPPAVEAALAAYTGWTIGRVERAIAGGATTYEAELTKGKKRVEVAMSAEGVLRGKEQAEHDEGR